MAHKAELLSDEQTQQGAVKDGLTQTMAQKTNEDIRMSQNDNRLMREFASTRLGQMTLTKINTVLKIVEDTAKWSLPQADDSGDTVLERPLPWLLFLTLIVWLRMVRICLSVRACVVGSRPITPLAVVKYVERQRTHLDVIRAQGLSKMKKQKTETTPMRNRDIKSTFMGRVQRVLNSAICKPEQHTEDLTRCVLATDVSKSEDDLSEHSNERLHDDGQLDEDNEVEVDDGCAYDDADDGDVIDMAALTISEMLDMYAKEDSDNDPDYIPKPSDLVDRESSSTSHTTVSSFEESENEEHKTLTSNKIQMMMKFSTSQSDAQAEEQRQANGHTPTNMNHSTPLGSANKQTPKQRQDTNGVVELHRQTTEASPPLEEVGIQSAVNDKKSMLNYVATPEQKQENENSTAPGCKTNESLQSSSATASKTAVTLMPPKEEKTYRTITTQTAIELDWTITIKTEITHTKHSPKLENLNYSVNLTPASSTEDIFYSPTGSLQDFHTVFHPVTTTNIEATQHREEEPEHYHGSSAETVQSLAVGPKKKSFNHSAHTKHYHHNMKSCGKNRR